MEKANVTELEISAPHTLIDAGSDVEVYQPDAAVCLAQLAPLVSQAFAHFQHGDNEAAGAAIAKGQQVIESFGTFIVAFRSDEPPPAAEAACEPVEPPTLALDPFRASSRRTG